MRIAVIGSGGQLGKELLRVLGDRAAALPHREFEIGDAASIHAALDRVQPNGVINAAAYNLVDQAETDPAPAFWTNAIGPGLVARACRARDIPFVHVSTDYVFGLDRQRSRPYREDELPGPVSLYGVSKAAGEQAVRLGADKHFIVRTCGLYGVPAAGSKGNFVQTIRRLAAERDELRVVDDQRCAPTSAADLATALAALIETQAWGTYHATNSGDCSWFEFAAEIVRLSGLSARVVPCTSAEFPRPARRPGYSVLDSSKLAGVLGTPLRPWPEALENYLRVAT